LVVIFLNPAVEK